MAVAFLPPGLVVVFCICASWGCSLAAIATSNYYILVSLPELSITEKMTQLCQALSKHAELHDT